MATMMHEASRGILSLIDVLPHAPTGSQHLQFAELLLRYQLLSVSDKAQVLNEVCEATGQLARVKEKLVVPMSEDASVLALGLLSNLMNGSRRTKRAIICAELLNFMRWVIQQYGPEDQLQRGASALTLISCHCCEPHPREFQDALLRASPEDFIATIGERLPDAAALDVSPRSFAFQSLRFIKYLTALVEGEARDVVLKSCCDRIWPVVVGMLMEPDIPAAWLVDDVPFCEWGMRGADAGGPDTFPSFLGVMVVIVRQFHRVKFVRELEAPGSAGAAAGSAGATDGGRPSVHFSDELLGRLFEMSVSRKIPESVRSACVDVLSMHLPEARAGCRRALKAHNRAWQERGISLSREDALEKTACGYARCGARETAGAKFRKCAGCKSQSYCSGECQKKDWKRHKPHCRHQ